MRIVITGASGNLGTALLRRLASEATGGTDGAASGQRHDIVGIVRRPPPSVAPYDAVAWHVLDLADPDAQAKLTPLLAGADAVVHLAWLFQPSRNIDYLERVAVGGSRAVLHAADAAGVAHLVHMSSVGTYSRAPDKRRVDESWPSDGVQTLAYSAHKAAVERLLDAYERDHPRGGVRIARLRPGIVMQREMGSALLRYGLPGWVPAWALRVVPLLPIDRRLVIPVVHTDDVAAAVVLALHRRATGAFNLAAEPPITRADLGAALGARVVHVPAPALSALLGVTWRARLQPLDPGWLDLAFAVPLMDTTRARTELGWEPTVDSRDALREAIGGMRDRAGTASPALQPRSMLTQLRKLLTSGPIGRRRVP
jgi:nucleoside-diphosphate-sugar epimerase